MSDDSPHDLKNKPPVGREIPENEVLKNKDKPQPNIHKNIGETEEDDAKSMVGGPTYDRVKPWEFEAPFKKPDEEKTPPDKVEELDRLGKLDRPKGKK